MAKLTVRPINTGYVPTYPSNTISIIRLMNI